VVRGQEFPQLHEGAHDRNVDLDVAFAIEDLESMATPCSVKAEGEVRLPPRPFFEVANCDLKASSSLAVRRRPAWPISPQLPTNSVTARFSGLAAGAACLGVAPIH